MADPIKYDLVQQFISFKRLDSITITLLHEIMCRITSW